MNVRRTLLVIAVCAAACGSVLGQYPRYVPPGGNPLPSQLDYFRRDVGVLDQYNTFVAPRRRLDRDLRMLQAQDQANFRQNQANQRGLDQIRNSMSAPTGTGATFMNYSHYYRK